MWKQSVTWPQGSRRYDAGPHINSLTRGCAEHPTVAPIVGLMDRDVVPGSSSKIRSHDRGRLRLLWAPLHPTSCHLFWILPVAEVWHIFSLRFTHMLEGTQVFVLHKTHPRSHSPMGHRWNPCTLSGGEKKTAIHSVTDNCKVKCVRAPRAHP